MFPQKDRWYYLFSKSGFDENVLGKAEKDPHIRLIEFKDM